VNKERMKNLPIYLKVLKVALKAKEGITIPELRKVIPLIRDLRNERLYHGFVKPLLEHGWLRRLRWHMRKLGGHEFIFKGYIGYVEHGTNFSKQNGIGQAGTIYIITTKGRKFLRKKRKDQCSKKSSRCEK
jgi:hypothetical protein